MKWVKKGNQCAEYGIYKMTWTRNKTMFFCYKKGRLVMAGSKRECLEAVK